MKKRKHRHRHRPNAKPPSIMQCYARMCHGGATIQERVLYAWLKERDPRWVPQHVWGYYVMDIWHPEHRVCIEVDGGYHNRKRQKEKDAVRDEAMRLARIKVLRVTNKDVDEGLAYCKCSELMGYEWSEEDFYRPIWSKPS